MTTPGAVTGIAALLAASRRASSSTLSRVRRLRPFGTAASKRPRRFTSRDQNADGKLRCRRPTGQLAPAPSKLMLAEGYGKQKPAEQEAVTEKHHRPARGHRRNTELEDLSDKEGAIVEQAAAIHARHVTAKTPSERLDPLVRRPPRGGGLPVHFVRLRGGNYESSKCLATPRRGSDRDDEETTQGFQLKQSLR
jgi:hypothetical protein